MGLPNKDLQDGYDFCIKFSDNGQDWQPVNRFKAADSTETKQACWDFADTKPGKLILVDLHTDTVLFQRDSKGVANG